MGQIKDIIHEEIIPEVSDRHANLLRVYRAPNNEVTIHFRNLKIVLHTEEEIQEWKEGFTEALKQIQENNYYENDI